ncbi:MAG: DUF1194 domain-containing protein [Pseudomonadota bacterium]
MKHAAFCLSALFLLFSPTFSTAQELRETGLELVLLADASGSIDSEELAFQRQGYAEALTDPLVIDAIEQSIYGSIAVTYVEWATNTAQVVDWRIISGIESAEAFAAALASAPREAFGRNAIGGALREGMRLIVENDIRAPRAVIDFSGDSMGNSSGPGIGSSRQAVLDAGITINALPILRPEDGRRAGRDLEALYQQNIIGGPGAFMVTAETRETFAEAVRRKIFLEIAGLTPDSYDFAEVAVDLGME